MNITVIGIDKAIQRIEKYVDLKAKSSELAERLAQVGEAEAAKTYGAMVAYQLTEDGARITISGEDVLFIEFGTGDAAGIHAAQYDAVPSVVRPGSWSETHAHQYEMLGFWWWHNTRFTETPPHPGAYDAYQAMVQALPQIAEEVFK